MNCHQHGVSQVTTNLLLHTVKSLLQRIHSVRCNQQSTPCTSPTQICGHEGTHKLFLLVINPKSIANKANVCKEFCEGGEWLNDTRSNSWSVQMSLCLWCNWCYAMHVCIISWYYSCGWQHKDIMAHVQSKLKVEGVKYELNAYEYTLQTQLSCSDLY